MASEDCAALDVDGVLVDSCPESDELVRMAWPEVDEGRSYPIDQDTFRKQVRTHIVTVGDFFSVSRALLKGEPLDDIQGIRQRYAELADRGTEAYRMAREALRQDTERWVKLFPLYPGVREMLGELSGMPVTLSIVSSRDELALGYIFDTHDLRRFMMGPVLDASKGRRDAQFGLLKEMGFEPARTVVYDDSPENLDITKGFGIHPVWAPQGYGLPERVDPQYKKALPAEFPGIVREILDI